MDAISFVLGIKSSQLRSNQLKELVYNYQDDQNIKSADLGDIMDSDQDQTSTCKVTIHFRKNNSSKQSTAITTLFSRAVLSNGSSEYRIDHEITNYQTYLKVLEKENVLVKARNFLVFQGDVETVASQSPKDLTLLIETISG